MSIGYRIYNMKIFLLTPVYATTTQGTGATPVVHYFAKEWVKQGHQVHVLYLRARYPKIYYWVSKHMSKMLTSLLNQPIHKEPCVDSQYEVDGVKVAQVSMRKLVPHSSYSRKVMDATFNTIKDYCLQEGVPDIFVGHWHNPSLELLPLLKSEFNKPTCIVFHNNGFEFANQYKESFIRLVSQIDIIGFRSQVGKKNYCKLFGEPRHSFIASSGVSSIFLEEGRDNTPDFSSGVHNFIYVGILMSRKYPVEVLKALQSAGSKDFHLTYVGDGDQKTLIEDFIEQSGSIEKVSFTGRIPREEVIKHLKQSQVFVMISKGEIFGLVYLEAMALGLIPIGSRNEGIDGIIRDGENGFLCDSGNVEELTSIINKIRSMTRDELDAMSARAKQTALEYSDGTVAKHYIENLSL